MKDTLMLLALVGISAAAMAQSVLKVAQPVWADLSDAARDEVQKRYLVEVAPPESYGVIMDTQGVDVSTQGTNGGAALGSAVVEAAYLDRSINNQNYSAKSQLGAVVLGGLLGSALDRPGVQQYHLRYAVKFANGNIKYFDVLSSSAFRHPSGVCVMLPEVLLAPDQGLCGQSPAVFRKTYLAAVAPGPAESVQSPVPPSAPSELVSCRLGTLAPVRTTAQKCASVNGSAVHD